MKRKVLSAVLIAMTIMTAGRAISRDDFEDAMLKAKKSLETAMQSSDESKILKAIPCSFGSQQGKRSHSAIGFGFATGWE